MRSNYLIRVSLIVCIVLLCTGFAVYSFMHLDAMDERRDFNLYTLIPEDVAAVFETDRAAELIECIDNMACSRDKHFLYASDLFSCVKKYLRVLMEKEPHGLSWEMNEILISFHNPDVNNDQVLYCRLGTDDRELLDSYISRYGMSGFSSKMFNYKGQAINIYPLADGRFLAVWMKRDFLVVSFQKRLIERVIDAWKQKKSLARLDNFRSIIEKRREENKAMIYVCWKCPSTSMPLWVAFDVKFAEEGIYCAGIVYGDTAIDSCRLSFGGACQLEEFPGDELPASTFLYKIRTLSVSREEVNYSLHGISVDSAVVVTNGKSFDEALGDYLRVEADSQILSGFFLSGDSLNRRPCAVMNIPMKDVARAQWELHKLLYSISQGRYPFYKSFSAVTGVSGLRLYRLPDHHLTAQLAGCADGPAFTCACFYRGNLLFSPDERDLAAYVMSIERGEVFEGQPYYRLATEKLSTDYQTLIMADMAEAVLYPEMVHRLLPSFLWEHADFFRHFLFSIQLCCVEGVVYPNLVFLYTFPDLLTE